MHFLENILENEKQKCSRQTQRKVKKDKNILKKKLKNIQSFFVHQFLKLVNYSNTF